MDAALVCVFYGFATSVDIGMNGAGEACNDRVLRPLCNFTDGFEIAIGGDRKSGFDDVHAHVVEDLGDLQLFLQCHGGTGRLLAVAQGGVKDADMVRLLGGSHVVSSLAWIGGSKELWQI